MSAESGPRRSDDGKFWWDGERWQPMPPDAAPADQRAALVVFGWVLAFLFPPAGLAISSMLNKPPRNPHANYIGMVSTVMIVLLLFAIAAAMV